MARVAGLRLGVSALLAPPALPKAVLEPATGGQCLIGVTRRDHVGGDALFDSDMRRHNTRGRRSADGASERCCRCYGRVSR